MSVSADVDIDITAHLGYIKNVDLFSRGLYRIKISLLFGEAQQRIMPIGLFSAPNRIDSFVRDVRVSAPPLTSPCEILPEDSTFCSRCIVVRYKDENHEFNEGVHWRLTIPQYNIAKARVSVGGVICSQAIVVRFELLHADLLPYDASADLMKFIEEYIPVNPVYNAVAVQDVQLQSTSSDFHYYYPVRFCRGYDVDMDVLFHASTTAIRYKDVSLSALRKNSTCGVCSGGVASLPGKGTSSPNRKDDTNVSTGNIDVSSPSSTAPDDVYVEVIEDDTSAVHTMTTVEDDGAGLWYNRSRNTSSGPVMDENYYEPPSLSKATTTTGPVATTPVKRLSSQRTPVSTVISTPTGTGGSMKKIASLISRYDTIYTPTTTIVGPTAAQDLLSPDSSCDAIGSSGPPSASGVSRNDIEALFAIYTEPVICNCRILMDGTQFLLDILEGTSSSSGIVRGKLRFDDDVDDDDGDHDGRHRPRHDSYIRKEEEVDLCYVVTHAESIIQQMMEAESMLDVYAAVHEAISICNDQMYKRWMLVLSILPVIMDTLVTQLKVRYTASIRAFWKGQVLIHTCGTRAMRRPLLHEDQRLASLLGKIKDEYRSSFRGDGVIGSILPLARGLRLFDPALHLVASRLPVLIIQQYTSPYLISNDRLDTSTDTTDTTNIATPPCVVITNSTTTPPTPHSTFSFEQEEGILERGGLLMGCQDGADIHVNDMQISVFSESARRRLEALRSPHDETTVAITTASTPPSTSSHTVDVNGGSAGGVRNEVNDSPISLQALPILTISTGGVADSTGKRITSNSQLQEQICGSQSSISRQGTSNSSSSIRKSEETVHVIVLQHGFQGSTHDMKILRNAIFVEFPCTLFLLAQSNEKDSGKGLDEMGENLAAEIVSFCKAKCPKMIFDEHYDGKISFICHSVGGLIARKALESERMRCVLGKLHVYISLASPHLGTLYADSQLVSTGMWALLKFKKMAILQQLALQDGGSNHTSSAVYRLSENGVLQHFKKVVFVSSPKDMYVPEYSARVQVNPKAILDPQVGYTVVTMAANILSQVEPERLLRVTLDNNTDAAKSVDKAIGRAAHICYLDDAVIAQQLVYTLQKLSNFLPVVPHHYPSRWCGLDALSVQFCSDTSVLYIILKYFFFKMFLELRRFDRMR